MAELGLLVNKFQISNRSGKFLNLYTQFNEQKNVDVIDKLDEYLQKVFQPVRDDNKDHAMGMGNILEKRLLKKREDLIISTFIFLLHMGSMELQQI